MKLSMEDYRHIHKVLSSDIDECSILIEGTSGGRAERLQKRITDDKRVLVRVEKIIGESPEYAPVQD